MADTSSTSINSLAETFLVVTLTAGASIHITSKWYNGKRSVDISLAYKELPLG